MKASDLKNSILQLAISGKLVSQDPHDEPASALFDKIQAERKRLIKEGKIKAPKAAKEIGPINSTEVPFEIPESWLWVRLGEIMNIVSARRVHQADWKKSGIPFYRSREIAKLSEFGHVDNELFISQELYDNFSINGVPKENDLMITAVGTIGKTYIVQKEDIFYYKDASVICFENFSQIDSRYIKFLMETPYMLEQIKDNSAGTTVDTITIIKANQYFAPLPPLAEQKCIVAKIKELEPLISRYGVAADELACLKTSFPDNLCKSILQYAIQGKLVAQNPADESAAVLLSKIKVEKENLLKEGKLKPSKLPKLNEPINSADMPFKIPNSWAWVRLGDICKLMTDGTHYTPKYKSKGVPFLSVKNISKGKIDLNNIKYISEQEHKVFKQRCCPEKYDILMTKVGTTGMAKVIDIDMEFSIFVSLALLKIFPNFINPYFLEILINSPYVNDLSKENTQGIGNKNLVLNKIMDFIIPIPPFNEQGRIVEYVRELNRLVTKLPNLLT
jgi:type I restriction enzyme S subunit